MESTRPWSALLLGLCLLAGMVIVGWQIASAMVTVKEYERTVTVKGLAERELPADIVIWPIGFSLASNNLDELYADLEAGKQKVRAFLQAQGIAEEAVTLGAPVVNDKSLYAYGNESADFRYTASQMITVYSEDIPQVRRAMTRLSELGQQGLVLAGDQYGTQTQYLFTGLNDIKPGMIEQATKNAREVAVKFAEDSGSRLGKIKRASQGQFSISERDANNPHIKNVRVVSTVEYYLSD